MLNRIVSYSKNHSTLDILRKVLFILWVRSRFTLFRKFRVWFYLKRWDIVVGSRVLYKGLINDISIGDENDIYDNCIFYFGSHSSFQTGRRVTFAYNVLVACHQKIIIGNNVMVGEFTSIRDSTHQYRTTGTMMGSQDIFKEIIIGNNVWIGRGCLITEGTVIEDGVVVAANSVVKGRLLKDSIYGGCPATLIKSRN